MKNTLNHDVIFYAHNGAKLKLGFHAENDIEANEYVQMLAFDLKVDIKSWFVGDWDKNPDYLIAASYKSKAAQNWKSVLKK
jgi:hypothetical protein